MLIKDTARVLRPSDHSRPRVIAPTAAWKCGNLHPSLPGGTHTFGSIRDRSDLPMNPPSTSWVPLRMKTTHERRVRSPRLPDYRPTGLQDYRTKRSGNSVAGRVASTGDSGIFRVTMGRARYPDRADPTFDECPSAPWDTAPYPSMKGPRSQCAIRTSRGFAKNPLQLQINNLPMLKLYYKNHIVIWMRTNRSPSPKNRPCRFPSQARSAPLAMVRAPWMSFSRSSGTGT
jgi:hypothetical protein